VLSIFLTIIGLWLTEAVPLPVTGLLVPVLAALYGVMPSAHVFDSFGSDILFLFLGCFLMARSMEKHGFDQRLAYFLLGRCMPGSSFLAINFVIVGASFFLSMWISNTSATAIFSAVTLGVLTSLAPQMPDQKSRSRAEVRLLLSCAFAASIGGLATPVGSPPNLIALAFLAERGITISFIDWMIVALPISVLMLVLLIGLFELLLPLRGLSFPGIQERFRQLSRGLGPMKSGERQIACIFTATVILWVMPGVLASAFPESSAVAAINSRLSMSVVGLLGGITAFFLRVRESGSGAANLNWAETRGLEWGTLMMFGGGLTLGILLEQSGAAEDLGGLLFSGDTLSLVAVLSLMVIASIVLSEFASNTAAASILLPIVIGVTHEHALGTEATILAVLAVTFAASFGFMLPVSTPPNALVYGTGKIPAREMRRLGVWFDVAGAITIILFLCLPQVV
jgi:sodium-dependent dicarboxylate transporter 2/3/5